MTTSRSITTSFYAVMQSGWVLTSERLRILIGDSMDLGFPNLIDKFEEYFGKKITFFILEQTVRIPA